MYIVCIDNVVRESNKRNCFSYINYLIDNDMLGNHGKKVLQPMVVMKMLTIRLIIAQVR
jgi:hypothetical protein